MCIDYLAVCQAFRIVMVQVLSLFKRPCPVVQPASLAPHNPGLLMFIPLSSPSHMDRADLCNQQDSADVMVCDVQGEVVKDVAACTPFSGIPCSIGKLAVCGEDTPTWRTEASPSQPAPARQLPWKMFRL